MTLSEICVRRPVLATVISLLIVVFGINALTQLPVRELPDIDRAVVSVTTIYRGAAPEIVDTDITEVVEGAVAGVAGVREIRSESRRGRSRTTITFNTGRDIDQAANDVRDAVGRVRVFLPADADEPQIVKSDSDADPVMRIGIVSDRMTPAEITDYIERFLIDRLATLDGVANVEINGQRRFAIRVWLDRRALAARDLTVADVEAALRRNNLELPAGEVESTSRELTVRLDSRIGDIEGFRRLVVASSAGGYPIRLADVARVELGAEDESTFVRADGRPSVGVNVLRQSQANTIAISNAVRAEIERLRPILPAGMEILVGSDDAIFIRESIKEVLTALGISIGLVVLVIFVFLMSPRATLVPAVTIPVAIIGSLILVQALGFSINVLTLLALLLAIGLVVDDAIVMLENIQRRIEAGQSPIVAAVQGSRQVTFAIIATSLTLVAVFIPLSFMQGQVGRLFIEFGLVLAAAVLISTFVALSLCPALCSRILKSRASGTGAGRGGRTAQAVGEVYRRQLGRALAAPLPVIVLGSLLAATSLGLYRALPQELTPTEDRAVIFVPVGAPQGSTVAYTDEQVGLVEKIIQPLRETGEVAQIFAIVGPGNTSNRGFVVARLAEWGARARTQREIVGSLVPQISGITGARAFPSSPSGLGLRGSSTPLRVVIGGPDFASVKEWADAIVERAEENPGLRNLEVDFEANQPQLTLGVDRDRADDLGISVEAIAQTLQTLLASREVTEFIDRGREYPVILQAQREDRRSPTDLANIFVRSGNGGALVPLVALVTPEEGAAAPELRRFDRLPAVTITASLADGYDLGSAIRYVEAIALETLPDEARLAYDGQSREFLEASGGLLFTFGLALLIVFLVLAAQFESWVHPLIIMLSVPLAVAGALFSLHVTGLSLNIYSQIGIVLLIGLMAKNGILIVEFANQLRDEGLSVREAVIEASVLRLRPIIMTVVSTVLGAVPLVIASGAGAESRIAIGTVIIGGLSLASVLTLFLTPVLYDLLARFTRPAGAVGRELESQLGRA